MESLTRKERDRRLRRTDILRAAERVFAARGYHKATICDIAKESQYAVGTIYLYFKDKEELYLTLIEGKIEELITTVKDKVKKTATAKERIKELINQHLSYFEDNQDFFRIYFSEQGNAHWMIKSKVSRSVVDRYVQYINYINELIKEAQEKNLIRSDIKAEKAAYILAAMLNAMTIPWLKKEQNSKDSEKLKDSGDFIFDIFLNGAGKR